ncbi:hypothetical protein [Pseudoclavibacter sp. 8L]|uniref:hypothetical protein n=1 Tax=Pseudoclavibacter sp. 8L TaxID=2653162 RepID=UPI0012F3E286|nr:hypothetical protein [Pseudoclavibacter sp. 8L]VXB32267.1 hypothetical protein PSCLAVI8L_130479 [Pseudoclavibacter sp. 8L]
MQLDLPVEAPVLELYAGDDFEVTYTLEGPDGLFDFEPFDLACQWRGGGNVEDVPVTSPALGTLRLKGSGTLSRAMLDGGALDIEGVRSDGVTITFVRAEVSCTNDVTRRIA